MSNALETALLGTLTGGTALTALLAGGSASVYNGQPPREGVLPWVQFSLASGIEENITPADTQRYVYLVKGVASSLNTAGLIAEQIHTLLHGTNLTVSGIGLLLGGAGNCRSVSGDRPGGPRDRPCRGRVCV